jgi:hypothetical protein
MDYPLSQRIVALDADGVLVDFDQHWREAAEFAIKRPLVKLQDVHDFRGRYGLSREEYHAAWDRFNSIGGWADIPVYAHTEVLVTELRHYGLHPMVLTSIPEKYAVQRRHNLKQWFAPEDIHCVGDSLQAPARKAQMLRKWQALAFLDDNPENTNVSVNSVPLCVMLDRKYQDLPEPTHGVTVIDDPLDFLLQVETLLERTSKALVSGKG